MLSILSKITDKTRVYRIHSYDWLTTSSLDAKEWVREGFDYVYDDKHDVICLFPMGYHISAIQFIWSNFYDFKGISHETVGVWQKVISDNLVIHGKHDRTPEQCAESLDFEWEFDEQEHEVGDKNG